MQHLNEKKQTLPGVAVPKVQVPKKLLLSGLAVVVIIGIAWLAVNALTYRYDDSGLRKELAEVRELADGKADRAGVVYGLNQTDSKISGILKRLDSAEKSGKSFDSRLSSLNLSVLSMRTDIESIRTFSQLLQVNITSLQKNSGKPANTTAPPVQNTTVDNRSCRQKLMDKHGLGPNFDVVYCCEARAYGFADECCACYR